MKKLLYVLLLLILVSAGWYYFQPQLVPTPVSTPAPAIIVEDNTQVFNLSGDNFRFTPDVLTVKSGQKVKIILTSVDIPHDFVVDELAVRSEVVQPGQTASLEFIPDKTGTFEFYCSVGKHRQMGMVGTITVE